MNTFGVVIIATLFGYLKSQTNESITTTPATDLTIRFLPPYDPYIITTDMANKLLSCDFQSNALYNRKYWYHNGTYVPFLNTFSINEVNKNVSGIYTCVLSSTLGFNVSASKQVIVQYGPTVTLGGDVRVVEHTNLVVWCTATGNPSPTIIWSRDGVPSFKINGRVLEMKNILRISSGRYTCTASNFLTPSGASTVNKTDFKTISIDVTYTPDIQLDPPTNPFIAYAEQPVVKIDCLVISANPNIISFKWIDSANTTKSNSNVLTLYNTSRHMAGEYNCSATNQVGTKIKTVNMTVQYAPIIKQMNNQTLTETGTLDVSCLADADPPVSKYWWIQPDGSIVNSSRLRITNIIRSQSGIYTCQAENILTPTGGNYITKRRNSTLHVDVRYGPGNSIKYSPSTNQYNLTEGEILPRVICSADCYPPCAFWWQTPVRTISSNILNADPISKEKRGRYKCYASNTIQTSTTSFSVIVNYKPVISTTAFQTAYVPENNKAVLQCRVDSQPLSDMTIEFNSSILFSQSSLNTKDYTIMKSDCLQTGTYICKAKNFVGEAIRSTNLFVYCSPRVDARSEIDKKKFVSPNKDTGNLNATMRIIAYPLPEMSWLFRDASGTIIPLPLETNKTEIALKYKPPLLTIHLIKYNFTGEDHGEYIVTYRNRYGQLVFTIVTKDIQIEQQTDIPVGAIVGSIVSVLVILVILSIVVVTWRKGFCHKPKLSKPNFSCFASCKDFQCMKCKDKNEDKHIYMNQEFAQHLNELENKQNLKEKGPENGTSTDNKNPTYDTAIARMDSHYYSEMNHHVQFQVDNSKESFKNDSNTPTTNPPLYVNDNQVKVKDTGDTVKNKVNYENVEYKTNKQTVLPKSEQPKRNKDVKNKKRTGTKTKIYNQLKETKQKSEELPQKTLKINAKASPLIQEKCANILAIQN